VKDIILWQSAAAREWKNRYLAELSALHQSVTPPSELLLPAPRKLRWKGMLKFLAAFEVTFLLFAACMLFKLCSLESGIFKDVAMETQQHAERLRRDATDTADTTGKARIEKRIRDNEDFRRTWRLFHVATLTFILGLALAVPLLHATSAWFVVIRPDLALLRSGAPGRGTVVGRQPWFLARRLEIAFTTARGEPIRKRQVLRENEASQFENGDHVWMLYLPRRPRCARIYGLKSALAEVVR
jgi:hypothetical protein